MSKAKLAAASNANQQASSSGSFAQGFLLGQLTLAVILFFFIKFFLFGDSPSADTRAAVRATARRNRTLSHSASLRRKRSSAALGARHITPSTSAANVLTTDKILEKTYYNVDGHQPESLDWFNVLIAQTIAQLRADALDDNAVLSSLTQVLNGPAKPDFLDDIRVTEISLGEEFPIFSNCRVIPVDEDGVEVKPTKGRKGGLSASRLQARMDVDLSDVVTLGIETKLVLNYPKPFVSVLPVALSVSVMRFSGTLSVSFTPSQAPPSPENDQTGSSSNNTASGASPGNPSHSPTTLTFTFLDDYRLDLSVHSLIGSRSRLQDVPKIAQLVEQRLHAWFDERCVEPRFQQIILPSLWPRKKNVRGGDDVDGSSETASGMGDNTSSPRKPSADEAVLDSIADADLRGQRSEPDFSRRTIDRSTTPNAAQLDTNSGTNGSRPRQKPAGPRPVGRRQTGDLLTEEDSLAEAGAEMREAERRDRIREARERERERSEHGEMRRRPGLGGPRESSRLGVNA
ncbi:hypothetical protein MBLNU457_1779t1 [Dothideomycetes sp. NU457]